MRTSFRLLSLATLVSFTQAGGIIDNSAEAAAVAAAASTLSGPGNYNFVNAATGELLAFRRSDVTNFYPSSEDGEPNQIQFSGSAARISGGNNKCVSAQFSYEEAGGGVDLYAVPYACAVGDGQSGTATLEKPKQWWYLVPADGSSSSNDDNDDQGDDSDDDGDSATIGVSLAVKTQSKAVKTSRDVSSDDFESNDSEDSDSSDSDSSEASSSKQKPSTTSSSTDDSSYLSHAKGYYEFAASTIPRKLIDQSAVVVGDRLTWPCVHPGWWLNGHPGYVTKDGHVECASDLKAYRKAQPATRRLRRSRPVHTEMARKFVKRGATQYYIIAQDHIQDMATRAISSQSVDSFGGYTSTSLSAWDKTDNSQLWTITEA